MEPKPMNLTSRLGRTSWNGTKDPALIWPMRLGQASLTDLIGAVAAQVERTGGDGFDALGAAEKQLQHGCDDLAHLLTREWRSNGSLLDADVEPIGKVIGCR